ncbi:FDLD family class I lanthipeptide [Tumebacillus flagellatus]|nr:FDLD family class I lanthipeptide [Tumebacillus flagellatus]
MSQLFDLDVQVHQTSSHVVQANTWSCVCTMVGCYQDGK